MSDDSPIVPFPQGNEDRLDAASWLAKLDRGKLSDAERAAFEAWLAADPRNRLAIKRIAGFWFGLDGALSALYAPAAERPARVAGGRSRFSSRAGRFAAAVAAAAIVVTVVPLVSRVLQTGETETASFVTAIGDSRQVDLSDGSTITLNTNSRLEQDYSGARRVVRLVSGEAVFDVAHDSARPFVVHAADGVIQAIGTRFAIRIDDENVEVTVTEGRVAMRQKVADTSVPPESPGAMDNAIIVRQGEAGHLHRTQGASKHAVTPQRVNERLSWLDGELVFYDREFQSIVEEIARYTPVVIRIEDEQLKTRRITGIIQIGDMDMMLESIEQTLGVTVERVSPTLVRLRT